MHAIRNDADREQPTSYLDRLTQSPLLTVEEERILTAAVKEGDQQARHRLVESNMRLVVNIARGYANRAMPLEDLIQEGAIGLMMAIERFDPSKGFRFSTYATHWIRQNIGRALDGKAKAIRLPAHVHNSLRKIERARTELMNLLGEEPTPEALAEKLGITVDRMKGLLEASQELVSLDLRLGDSEGATLGSILRDPNCPDPEGVAISHETLEELHEVMMHLSDRERRVVVMKIRMADEGKRSEGREEMSAELHVSRERIRQIETQAIKKLRAVAQRKRLKEYLQPGS